MWISYSDSEVNKYHPICERALNQALRLAGKDMQYKVIHHQYTSSLEMDFVIQNKSTGKYLCVIEVKRTPADVHSARYQFQAMSYVQMNTGISEKPFYILTNLEYAFAFRYDANRPRVFQQMLKPGLISIGNFEKDDEMTFTKKLTEYFKECINAFCSNHYDYLVTLQEFAFHMEHIKNNSKKWKSHLAILLYEYIRGAFTYLKRNDLPDIRIFHNDIARICDEAARVNFKDIFNYSDKTFEKNVKINNSILVDLYDFGNQNVTGDFIAGILHQIVSEGHEHEGEVATDLELGRLVATLAKYVNGNLSEGEFLCDPAAGSGNLISSSVEIFGLSPKQILVNDYNPKLLELLSLRLGLNYAMTISRNNSPVIFNKNVVNLDRDFFANVKVIVMNPPFVAGINCVERKQEFYRRIRELAGRDTGTNIGQMPLEAAFLELITYLVRPGTTIACIFPKTHLMARGIEAKIIRSLILNNLGLRVVFTYPGDEIFNDVTKDTCILVGKAMQPVDFVDVVAGYEKIPDLDIHRFEQSLNYNLNESFQPIMPGVVAKKIPVNELCAEIENGWRMLNSEMVEAISFVKEYFESSPQFVKLSCLNYNMKRGQAGNTGGSDIIFFDSREDLYSQFQNQGLRFRAGMRNAKLNSFNINGGDSQFLDISINDIKIIEQIIDAYNMLPERNGKQQRHKKDRETWIKILQRESRGIFGENSVLIPRAIRRTGRIYLADEPVFVSTNFVVCTLPTYEKALLLATWMSTVFYQLICEVSSKDQEGMRKMEVNDIGATYVPYLDNVTQETIDRLQAEKDTISFLNLNNPEIRNVDKIWAEELFNEKAEEILQHATRLLGFLANRRNP